MRLGALAALATAGKSLAGDGDAAPDAKAFLRGMGGREIGVALSLLTAIRAGDPVRPWLYGEYYRRVMDWLSRPGDCEAER